MDAFHAAAWALVAYIAIAIIGGVAGIIGCLIIRRRALREFEQSRKEMSDIVRPRRGRFKL